MEARSDRPAAFEQRQTTTYEERQAYEAGGPVAQGPAGTPSRDGQNGASAREIWEDRTRVVLSPVSAPSVLGLFGFSAATLIVAAHIAGWYGNSTTFYYLAPFAIMFGGVAQFLAGMWSYKARDTLATAMHGMWGSFWMAWGLLYLLGGTGTLAFPVGSKNYWPALGFWFIMLCLLTGIGALASLPRGIGMFGTLACLSGGSGVLAAALLSGNHGVQVAAGWVLVASCGFAVYTGAALLLAESYGRTILPTFEFRKDANVPGRMPHKPIEFPEGMPGVRVGQ